MVSFRFHLVSLVAVFLALGLGVLAGTTVINQNLVRDLERRTADAERRAAQAERSVERTVRVWRAFGAESFAYLVPGRLAGDQVVVVTQEGTDETAIDDARRALEEAGADMLGLLTVSERVALSDQASREELAEIIGALPTDEPAELTSEAATEMASELAFPGEPEVLNDLIRAEFVLVRGRAVGESVVDSLDGDEAVVVIGGWRERPTLDPESFLVPLVEELAADGAPVAAAESVATSSPFVSVLRDDPSVNGDISTQDNVDQLSGEVGLVLAVEDLLNGSAGHYGVKDGADGVIPPP
jgi:copper transport outer membrane protein MctB